MNIIDLLKFKNLDINKKIKLVRHQTSTLDIKKMALTDQLEIYQSYQTKPVFNNCDYIVCFIGEDRCQARFYGVYAVEGGPYPANQYPVQGDLKLIDEFKKEVYSSSNCNYYKLSKLSEFDDYKNRVIINWGKSTLSWAQWLSEKEVVEIKPKGFVMDFPGYFETVLDFIELEKIINNPEGNINWKISLSTVAGIYLIVDRVTGKQYVGSACGKEGIWGRWKQYAYNGHGGNALLEELLTRDNNYKQNFQFSILQTLPKNLSKDEVVGYESFYKHKLGSRAFGLNAN